MKNIVEILPELIKATQSGNIQWRYMKDAPCLSVAYNNNHFMMCKAANDNNVQIISLNYIDKNEMIIGDFMKWRENESEYNKLNQLYTFAEQKKVLLTC